LYYYGSGDGKQFAFGYRRYRGGMCRRLHHAIGNTCRRYLDEQYTGNWYDKRYRSILWYSCRYYYYYLYIIYGLYQHTSGYG
jgi:hypothetical protein